jgi:transmembrane sensor
VHRVAPLDGEVAEVVERPVARGPHQVRAEGLVGAERLAPAPEVEEDLLHHLLCHGPVAQHPLRDADEQGVPAAEDRVERRRVAGAQAPSSARSAAGSGGPDGGPAGGGIGSGTKGPGVGGRTPTPRAVVGVAFRRRVYKVMSEPPSGASAGPVPPEPARPPAAPTDPGAPDWEALARLWADGAGEGVPADASTDAETEAAARRWLADHRTEAARLDALRAAVNAALAPPPAAPVDVEAALARVTARRLADNAAAARPSPAAAPAHPSRTPEPRPAVARPPAPAWAARPAAPRWGRRTLAGGAAGVAMLVVAVVGIVRSRAAGPGDAAAPAGAQAAAPRRYTTPVGGRDELRLADGTRVVLGPASTLTVDAGTAPRAAWWRSTAWRTSRCRTTRGARSSSAPARPPSTTSARPSSSATTAPPASRSPSPRAPSGSAPPTRPPTPSPRAGAASVPAQSRPRARLRPAARGRQRRRPPRRRARRRLGRGRRAPLLAARVPGPAAGVADDTAWTSGRLVFRDAPLPEVAAALRRWYGIELRATDPAIAGRHLTATFRGDPLPRVLQGRRPRPWRRPRPARRHGSRAPPPVARPAGRPSSMPIR